MDHTAMIQRSLDYIEANLKTEITAAELAEQAGFSLFHYYRLFQSATGMPVMQYILRRRLLHGIYAIACGSTGIDAALTYGFDTYAGFYRAFLREFDCTPSRFLQNSRAKQPYAPNLTKEETMTVTRKKAAAILCHWGLEKEPVSDIYYDGTGSRNHNAYYVGDSYVLKFTGNLGKVKNHISLSRAMEDIGLCAATAIPAADGQQYIRDGELYFYLTRRLPGQQMVSGSLYREDYAENARFVGEIIGQLHLALARCEQCVNDTDTFETVKSWALPQSREALGLSDAFCASYLDAFERLYPTLPRQIIHRDPNPGNIIRAGEKWGFIDFELSERNVRIFDPCYAATAVLSECFGTDEDKWVDICRNIILGYDSVAKLTSRELEAIPYVILANQFVCVAWFAGQDKYAELFETNRKMTLWLIDNFEKLHFAP